MEPLTRPQIVSRLRAAGCVFAEDEAGLLLAAATDPGRLIDMVARREAGLPLEQIIGWAEFCGLRILVEPGVFVPRRRTGYLAERAVALAPARGVLVDLCCGTGAIAALLRQRRPEADVHAADLDPAAVHCARRNLPAESVHEGDLYDALPAELRGRVDVLAANAPYVPTDAIALMPAEAREHEARIALDGGTDGLDLHRRIAAGARRWLAPGGHLLIETSDGQAERTAGLMTAAGLAAEIRRSGDLGATVVVGTA
jgi:release factor glutamine methyltransferase